MNFRDYLGTQIVSKAHLDTNSWNGQMFECYMKFRRVYFGVTITFKNIFRNLIYDLQLISTDEESTRSKRVSSLLT